MNEQQPAHLVIEFDASRYTGRLFHDGPQDSPIWKRLQSLAISDSDGQTKAAEIELPWTTVLGFLKDFGTKQQQLAFNFRFQFRGEAEQLARRFVKEVQQARIARASPSPTFSAGKIEEKLKAAGFTKRQLRSFQIRDLIALAAMQHGANFSVPGAGKTTVTLALHILIKSPGQHLFVVAPKTAFSAWTSVVDECIDSNHPGAENEPFIVLDGTQQENEKRLQSTATRFLMSYDLMIRQQQMLSAYFARQTTHVVLDESHRMKAGFDSRRGAYLLNIAPFISRRDILTGTPMPQSPQDMASQLGFLWPGHGLDWQIQRGDAPKSVLGKLYVRTTKGELGLPSVMRSFKDVPMLPGQKALYSIVRSEALRKLSSVLRNNKTDMDIAGARKSVMRLLQLSANPVLALKGMTKDIPGLNSGIVDAVLEEGPSAKMQAVADRAREINREGRKVVIWTIFTDTVSSLERMLVDTNPVSLYGLIPVGSEDDPATREWRLKKFHDDASCMVMIANPAAAGEGISLHRVCHDAIYLDRSYVSTHYLQSLDRIHRLGLPPDVSTRIEIFRTKAPASLGSIDYSVSRRLAKKIRALQDLLDDSDLHEIALDEENADDPIDYSVDLQDLVDLVEELEGKKAGEDTLE